LTPLTPEYSIALIGKLLLIEKESKMKKINKKLAIKKVTLKNLDETMLQGIAGGATAKTLCGPASRCTAGKGIACC
jgi:hypothetical protein